MAENTVSNVIPSVNGTEALITEHFGLQPAILSTDIALRFQKKHKHVLNDINRLLSILPDSFRKPNFGPTLIDIPMPNGAVRKSPAYLLTRDAFSLLVMGFTGTAAIRWKLKYIEAFNALEAAALGRQTELAHEAGYAQGRDEALSLPSMQAERQAGYLAGLNEGNRLWQRSHSPRALLRMAELRRKGLTWREVGAVLGITANAARKRLASAVRRGMPTLLAQGV